MSTKDLNYLILVVTAVSAVLGLIKTVKEM